MVNIVVFKPSADEISEEVRVNKQNSSIKGIQNLVLPNHGIVAKVGNRDRVVDNQDFFMYKLVSAAYALFDNSQNINISDISLLRYDNVEMNMPFENFIVSETFRNYSQNTHDNILTDLNGNKPKNRVSGKLRPLISVASKSLDIEIFQVHDLRGDATAYVVEKKTILSNYKNGRARARLSNLARKPKIVSPILYVHAIDKTGGLEKNIFSDPVRADYMANVPKFLDLGLQVVNNKKLNNLYG